MVGGFDPRNPHQHHTRGSVGGTSASGVVGVAGIDGAGGVGPGACAHRDRKSDLGTYIQIDRWGKIGLKSKSTESENRESKVLFWLRLRRTVAGLYHGVITPRIECVKMVTGEYSHAVSVTKMLTLVQQISIWRGRAFCKSTVWLTGGFGTQTVKLVDT